jgi:hypothetical protein
LVIGIATSLTMDVATLKPYTEPFERSFYFSTLIDTGDIEFNHFQN